MSSRICLWASVVLTHLSFTYLAGWLIVDVYRYFQSVFNRSDTREEIPRHCNELTTETTGHEYVYVFRNYYHLRNCLLLRSTWIHPGLVEFMLLDL
jgi:aminoglycoside/choline kinase family phosphotransferase